MFKSLKSFTERIIDYFCVLIMKHIYFNFRITWSFIDLDDSKHGMHNVKYSSTLFGITFGVVGLDSLDMQDLSSCSSMYVGVEDVVSFDIEYLLIL